MRRWLGLGAAAVAIVVVGAILLARHEGYLGGVADGGPLEIASAIEGGQVAPGESMTWGDLSLEVNGDPVTIDAVDLDVTPGLRARPVRLFDRRRTSLGTRLGPVPTGFGAVPEGARVGGDDKALAVSLTAPYA